MRWYCYECGGTPCVFTCPPCERTSPLVIDDPTVCPWLDMPVGIVRQARWRREK